MKTIRYLIKLAMLAVAAMVFPEAKAADSKATSVTEYHGNIIYMNGSRDKVLFHGGYATVSVITQFQKQN